MMNQNLSFSMGDQKKLFGREFGFIVGLTYQHNFEYYDDGRVGRFFLPGVAQGQDLVVVRDFTQDMKGTESVLWGALANLSYRINPSHKLSLNLVRNQSSDLSSRFLQGVFPADANLETDELQVRSIRYIERALASVQLKGDHKLTGGGLSMNWSASGTSLRQEEPDQRFFNNVISVDSATEQATYYTFQNATGDPARYYRTLDEKNFDGKLNVEIPLSSVSQDSKVKLGGAYLFKDRNFLERIISNKQQAADNYEGIVDEYFSQGNVGLITSNPYRLGIYSVETQNLGGSYNGQERIPAAYAMADLKVSRRFRVSAGARYEGTDIALYATSPYLPDSLRSSTVKRNDILPAANLTWEIGDNMNLRVAYGNTIARPTFRELSQYTSFDFLGDSRETGNPNLRRTSIQNTDIRWEVFPSNKEYISVSAFYKDFTDPIERVTSPYNNEPKDGISFYYNNVDRARLYGAEFEVRKSLGFISSQLADFRLGANVTLMKSQVDISPIELEQIRVNNPEAEAQRALAGQSPYIVNANLGYSSAETGWDVTLIYNVIGPRLFAVSTNGTPNIYEQPRNALDMTVRKSLGSRSTLRLSMQNLLDAPYRFTQEFAGKEYIYQSYSVGTTFSLGFSYLIE
jgi:TonB-dependent receptor